MKDHLFSLNYGKRYEDMIDHRSLTHNLSSCDSLIAQLVEHCKGIAEVMGSNSVQA